MLANALWLSLARFNLPVSTPKCLRVFNQRPGPVSITTGYQHRAGHPLSAWMIAIFNRLHANYKYLNKQIVQVEKELQLQLQEDDLGQ